jgi:hypothetical protein
LFQNVGVAGFVHFEGFVTMRANDIFHVWESNIRLHSLGEVLCDASIMRKGRIED